MQCACGCGSSLEPLDRYGRPRKFLSGHNGRKYTDPTQYKREWNHRNRPARQEYKKLYHQTRKVQLVHLKGGKCIECGLVYNGKNACVFHLHHRAPHEKEFSIGNQLVNKAWKTLVAEAEKCDLLCANCHEMKHSEEF